MNVEEFADQGSNGSVIENALAFYSEKMREDAELLLAEAWCPQREPKPHRAGFIDITPAPAGLRMTSEIFTDQADRADEVRKAWLAETEGPDEGDAELLGIDPDGTHHFRI
jgi:hypothetical protein